MNSTAIRFVLLYLTLSVASAVPILFFIYHQTNNVLVEGHRSTVDDRTAILLREYRTGGLPRLGREVSERTTTGVLAHGILLLADSDGRKIAGNIAAWPPSLKVPTDWREMLLYREGHSVPERFGLSTTLLPAREHLLVGITIGDRAPMREALMIALVGALLLAIPIGLAGSLVLLRFMNRRVHSIGDVAARIAAGDLSRRVETLGTSDPFDELGASLNAMLARIEALVEELRLVTDALAHDLRSPLMRIRAWIEKGAEQPPGTSEREAMGAISHEIDGMLRMIAGTLDISRTEAGTGQENFVAFDLGELMRDLCEMYQPLAEESGISIAVEKPGAMPFFGNRELVGEAVSNLVDNALKYAASGGSIRIGGDENGASVSLWVADQGPGIPASRREEALRKYGRLDAARVTEGSGLGLALVQAVARLHGGELILEDNNPGLRAILRFPLLTDPAEPPVQTA
ncbi:MAG: Signal transduction histidine kinase [Alphaproteobacteria bacterium]|nr:Signal transduction histidine kinase [Alphaproteobacteria bacterium]